MESIRTAVIVPTYNNVLTISGVISDVKRYVPDVIVVNDGSTDNTGELLRKEDGITLIEFSQNRGKGAALKEAFRVAREKGFTHAITVDADGQHLADDIPLFLDKIKEDPSALYIGDRIIPVEGGTPQPARSRIGRRFGAFWYKAYTGIYVRDTQSGFRSYPLEKIAPIPCSGQRYEFEIEILICAAWNSIPVKSIPVHLLYQPPAQRVSHFRPVRDFFRISKVNSKAAISRLFLPKKLIQSGGLDLKGKVVSLVLNELRANTTPPKAAFSLAFGVFMGISPTHGFQVITLLALSFIFRLNRPLALLGVSVSSAPLLPFWIAAGVWTGKIFVPAAMISSILTFLKLSSDNGFITGFVQWVIGSIVLAVVFAVAVFGISLPLFRSISRKKRVSLGTPSQESVESVSQK